MSKINMKVVLMIVYILIFPYYLHASNEICKGSDYSGYFLNQPTEQTREERKARRQERKAERQAKREAKKQESEEPYENKSEIEVHNLKKNTSNTITNSLPKQVKTNITNSTTNSNSSTISTIKNKNSELVPRPSKIIPDNPKQSNVTRNQEKTILEILFESKLFWIGIIILFISFSILSSGYKRHCKRCRKWWAMRIIGKKLIDEKASTILKKEDYLKDKRTGKVLVTQNTRVPATIYTYLIHRKCKYCGYEDNLTKEEKREN